MNTLIAIENRAQICRVTCGWKLPHLPLEAVLRYWRDVHSPSIARRPGIWEYRHFQLEPLDPSLLGALTDIETACPTQAQLMWISDVRYHDDDALAAFSASPSPAVRASMLADIDLIVDQSTTYRVIGDNGHTYADRTLPSPPQGPPPAPTFAIFFRRRSDEPGFRAFLNAVCERWTDRHEVHRLRMSLFETPDMAAEQASGYPVKTHPVDRQYQAWIDLTLASGASLADLFAEIPDLAEHCAAIHAFPARAVYTSNRGGKPTLVGLRGYPAYEALVGISGYNQADPALLEWMYGDVAHGVRLEPAAS